MEPFAMDLLVKLNAKEQTALMVLNTPASFLPTLEAWESKLTVVEESATEPCPFVLIFTRDKAQLEEMKPVLKRIMDPAGLIWIAYPKKTSKKYKSDLSRDDFWEALKDLGLEPVRQIAVDEDWSALRFRLGSDIKRKQ